MRSKTLFVWLMSALGLLATLALPQQANAQINVDLNINAVCVEDPTTTPNNIIDELGDVLTFTARAAYFDPYCDSVDVGLDPQPDLGVLIPALYPTIIINCPSSITSSLYEMAWTRTDNTGLDGAPGTDPDSCLVVATLTFHPEGVAVAAGTPLQFGITWFGFANTPPPGGQETHCVDAGYTIAAPCSINSGCAFIQFAEYGGIQFDGIAAIGDSIWLDSALAITMDSLPAGDSLVWDVGGVTCEGAVDWRGLQDTVEIQPCFMENEFDGCASDTIFLIRFEWDDAGGEDWADVLADPAAFAIDTFFCVRPIDNLPPVIDIYCVDSCQVVNHNYMDNDTIAGCDDVLRIFLSTTQAAQGKFPVNCDGDSVDLTYSYVPDRIDCDEVAPNDDVEWLGVNFGLVVQPGDTFPQNYPDFGMLAVDSLWVSARFGAGANPGAANNLIWVDVPIDQLGWDSLEICIFEAAAAGDSIYVQSIDDAGNPSSPIAWGYEVPDPDPAIAIEGCDACLDNQAPDLPGSDVYWSYDGVDNYCNQRFSPYDSALASYYTNLTPDSIRWYLSGVDTSNYDVTNYIDVLTKVYLIGFDVRQIPDDDDDTPTGAIISWLDYYTPTGAPDSINWEWRNPVVPSLEEDACFTWYGKDGPDSLDPDFDFLADYCPWGMLVGITEGRYMDAGGCNAVLGSDHDGITSILDGYTQLNALYAVVDSCFPTTTIALDLDTLNGPALGLGPDYGSINDPYLWVDGDDNPWLQFKARRWFTQGLLDTCLAEDLCYTIRLDSIYTQGPWPFGADSVVYYDHTDGINGSFTRICEPLPFFFNDINTDTISFEWGRLGPSGDPLPDGLYCLTLELQDNAGNVYRGDQVCMWLNGLGPEIDSIAIVNENLDCNLNFFAGESLCVWLQTDTSAHSVLFDFSCILNADSISDPNDSVLVTTEYSTDGATFKRWKACFLIDLAMIDTTDVNLNDYRIGEYDADCLDPSDYGIINVKAFDSDGNYSQADTLDGTCIIALLGESRCPRIVGPIEFYFFDPDTIFPAGVPDLGDSINSLFAGFDDFGPMPEWNAMSPGSVDSSGAYDAITNPAHDQRHDSIFVRILLDTLSITNWDIVGPDTTYHDTLVLEFRNPNTVENRSRQIRKPLFIPACANLDGAPPCEDPDNNTIYDGRLELDEVIGGLAEFRYQWNGTWFINAGTDSQMLVPITGQDTIIVSAWTVDGDSLVDSISVDTMYFLICDTTFASLDVDNDNPEFVEWTGIAAGAVDPITHSTATVDNIGWDGDCGFRYAEGDTFQIVVHADEQVHYDPNAYPNTDGSAYDAIYGQWLLTGNWQISIVDSTSGQLIDNGAAPGTYIQLELISVAPESIDVDEWQYTLTGRIYNMPADTFIYNSCFVVRGAWDQGANPGRYNEPPFSDAFEFDSFEDTTFCVNLIPCDPWADGCPDVFGPDNILGWIAPEDTNITVAATIIETCEIHDCVPGTHADSLRVVEGDFQRITDDPNPWIVPDSVGAWYIYVGEGGDSLGWARDYYWTLRADSSDLATIWCDGSFLDFTIRFVSWEGVASAMLFDSCVQVDVNEPMWTNWFLWDSLGAVVDQMDFDGQCYDPENRFTLVGCVTDNGIDCPNGIGVGVDTTQMYADLSVLLQDPLMDNVKADSVVIVGLATEVYPYVGAPVAINDLDTAEVVIDDPDAGLIQDVNVTIIDLQHTYDSDLQIVLISPSGTEVALSNYRGSSDDDFVNTVFDDEALDPISSGSAPFTDTFQPDGQLNDFDNEDPNGTWTLVIRDQVGIDIGVLNDWSIEITYYTGSPEEVKALAYWTFTPDEQFYCINTTEPWFRFHAATDMIGHYDRELFLQDTLDFCSDCVPPFIDGIIAGCECDTVLEATQDFLNDGWGFPTDLPYLSTGSFVSFMIGLVDVDHDSSLGLVEPQWADLSSIDTTYDWTASFDADEYTNDLLTDSAVYYWGFAECEIDDGFVYQSIELNYPYHNGDTIFVNFALIDAAGNADTVLWPVAIYDSLPPIVDFIYTIGDDSIRGYISPDDQHIHVYADINGYVNDLVSAPEHVWADFSQFQCDSTLKAAYDTVYANYVEHVGGDNYRAWWGWYPGSWVGNPMDVNYLIPGDTTSLPWDTLSSCDTCGSWNIGAEGWYDSIFVYVTDASCNYGQHFNVFEVSGCDSTTPGLDSVWVWGNHCGTPGWISSTPLDSGHIEVWAFMDTTFDALEDTLTIDSLQANLIMLGSPRWDHTNWSTPDFFGGWPVYDTLSAPDSTRWDTMTFDGRVRLIGKWLWLTADDLGDCEEVIVPVKSIRQTGLGGSHGYYMDVEYGYAHVDTTRPIIYDMRVHSSTTSDAETTWVTPNYPLYVDVWALDTGCELNTDHIGFDLDNEFGGPGPFITFCGGILDSLWTWDTTAFDVLWYAGWNGSDPITLEDAAAADSILIRFIGTPINTDSCAAIDADNLTGCVEAHIEDCLSNPAIPVQKTVTTDDRPPQFVNSLPWGDYTIATGFPGDPDINGIDSVLVLQNSNYNLDWDSTLFVYVIVDNFPGDTLLSWEKTYIDFTGFMNTPLQYPDSIYYNIDGNSRDSILWVIPLYDDGGAGPLFNTNIVSNRYWWHLYLSDSLCNRASFYCVDLDSAVSFTIQNWSSPTTGMQLLCDSNTVAGSDSDFVDQFNMDLWNNEKVSPDVTMENLYKIWHGDDGNYWNWYSHEDVNQTRFFVFVEDTVLQADNIDNDNDGLFDETGEGVDFYTADLRINEFPQVGHVDSMNVEGVWINYLWFADNFSEGRYDVKLYISDIYGHRDTLACGDFALTFYEDETCPNGNDISFMTRDGDDVPSVNWNGEWVMGINPGNITADDSIFVGGNFDSLVVGLFDPDIFDDTQRGSGVDFDTTTTVDSTNWNSGAASSIRLLDPNDVEVAFVQVYDTSDGFAYNYKSIYLVDPTGTALEAHPDGIYTIEVVALDNMGNSCTYNWYFTLDRTCPDIQQFFAAHPGQLIEQTDLYTSWDYVELRAIIDDALDGVEEVRFDYAFDANRDEQVDAYSYWQTRNIWVAGSNPEDGDPEWPFAAYWNIRNLTWNNEDTLGLPPVNPDSCLNTWFLRVHAWDMFGNYCVDTITVHITDDIAPLAFIQNVDGDTTPQGYLVPCFEPNVDTDSLIEIRAFDFQGGLYDPLPGDTAFAVFSYSEPEADLYFDGSDYTSEIYVDENFEILDINVSFQNLTSWEQYCVSAYLESPNGTTVTLIEYAGDYENEITNLTFDDEAFVPLDEYYSYLLNTNNAFRPIGSLSDFDGELTQGTWTLHITSTCGYESELGGWSMVITERPIGGLATYQWFDLAKGMFQFKYFEAPGTYVPGNTDPAAGWVTMVTPGQDSVTYRQPNTEDFVAQWNIAGLPSHQYNLRFLTADVCDNVDALNTPVITVRIECDTTAPMALICFPTTDLCVTNMRCDTTQWVPVQSTAPIMSDVDSVAYFFIDSLSVPGLGIHQFIGGANTADSVVNGWAFYHSTAWNTDNLLSGYYWLYAVAYDDAGLFDSDPIMTRVFVDNAMPQVTECWIGDSNGDDFATIQTIGEGQYFYLRANAEDNIGLGQDCGIYGVQFQFEDRYGNWRNLESASNWNEAWGADVYTNWYDGLVTYTTGSGYYELSVYFEDFGNSPLDSVRFRAYAIDNVAAEGWGDNNMQGDYNRDCNLDRDLTCGEEICCSAIEIRDELPSGTHLWCFNHAWFQWGLPQYSAPTTPIYDGDKFSTCNYQTPIDTLLLVANVADYVEDEWLMYFKFWRADGTTDTFDVPNDYTMNPALPRNADSAVVLESTWDSVYVVWPGVRAFLDSADAADGLVYSRWDFAAIVEDLTGNQESMNYGENACFIYTFCPPNTPITDVSYVTNDVNDPENRIRVNEPVAWEDTETDTIEVLYNRTTDPNSNDPEALVLFQVDASSIRNCHDDSVDVFNIELWQLDDEGELQSLCDEGTLVDFDYFNDFKAWDQYPPDNNGSQYQMGLYLDNNYAPGVYNFAVVVNYHVYAPFANDTLNEGDTDCDGFVNQDDYTKIDLVVRVVNVNEPQVVYCYPPYGDVCGAHNTVPLSANDVSDPSYFSGDITQVAFERWDGNAWVPVIDPVTGVNYDSNPGNAQVRFQLDEKEVPGMAGWYYDRHSNPVYSWYAERDLFPDVAVYVWDEDQFYPMTDDGNGFWTVDISLSHGDESCFEYSFVIDANDNNLWEANGTDRWVDDPRNIDWDNQDPIAYDRCDTDEIDEAFGENAAFSTICLCEYVINFNSQLVGDGHHEFRTVVTWYDGVAYHVIENPAPGDSLHVFFVDNDAPVSTHDIEFDNFWLNGGRCDDADDVYFVTDIQPVDGDYNLVVEDICAVIYQVSLTSNPFADSSWVNVDTIYSNDDMGWTEAWPGIWGAINPITDNIDNDGDGLVDETYDVQAGDGRGEENTLFWSRSIVTDHCGNTYCTVAESIWVDVSEPRACISLVGGEEPGVNGNDVVVVPDSRDLEIVATNQDYAGFDQSILGVFQYRTLNPIGSWTNIQSDTLSNDTVRHIGNTITATWDLLSYFQETGNDPEGWYQLRVIAIDTVNNTDLCDNDVCYVTIRLNDIQPAARIEIFSIINENEESAASCTVDSSYYIHSDDPYCIQAIFAPTNIDTGLASITFQYAEVNGGIPSAWRNIETIHDPINNGLNGDTTVCVSFQPQPEDVGDQEIFWIRAIVEDYNGNDTSDAVVLYVDALPPTGDGVASGTLPVATACGDRCRFDIEDGNAVITMTFDPDQLSGEFNEDEVWLSAVREDSLYWFSFGSMTRGDDDEWTFDFGGDLCEYWTEHRYGNDEGGQFVALDYGCYTFTVHFTDCIGNEDSVLVTTNCGDETTNLVCIDCYPTVPEHTDIQALDYEGYDCVEQETAELTDEILDGTTEIGGDQTVTVSGVIPDYEQDIHYMVLYVESADAGITETAVDTFWWNPTFNSHNTPSWSINWWLADTTDEGAAMYPSGYYRVWARAHDAICQIEPTEMLDEFWVHVDHAEPVGDITQVNGQPVTPENTWFEINSGDDNPATLWVDWTDGLTPDDSTQTNNIVQVWAKNIWHPNQADAWTLVGYVPSPCNPHYVELDLTGITCGDSLHLVPIVQDRWGNGDLDVERVMDAYDAGHAISIYIFDTTAPSSMLWSVGMSEQPWCDDDREQGVEGLWIVDQQTRTVSIGALGEAHDIWLHAFSMIGDNWPENHGDIQRVYFEYSLDGTTWFEIGVDESDEIPCEWNGNEPTPWWSGIDHEVFWSQVWDVSGLAGDIQVRTWAEDECGNLEEMQTYTVSLDVIAPMAKVFVWPNGVNVDNLETCADWTEPQVADSLERFDLVTLGACADEEAGDAYGAIWYIKRADDHPLEMWSWCNLGDDSTGPFSENNVDFWNGDCPSPEAGVWYDVAVLTTDQAGNELTWTQFLNHGAGTTWEEKWQSLIDQGYVKRFRVVDHVAPLAHSLEVAPDCTPDSSMIYLHGNIELYASVDDRDVVAVTFAFLEVGSAGPWTVIERVEGEGPQDFGPAEGYWNTELLNGVYWLGAFAEDSYGNMNGNLTLGESGAPNALLQVNVDNEAPVANIVSVWRTNDPNHTPLTELERGSEVTFQIEAQDNMTVRKVRFYYRHTNGDPTAWTQVGGDRTWPFSFNWTVPTDFVVGWNYDFAAVAVDYCEQTDQFDDQGNYIIDWTAPVIDEEANISIYAINDFYDVEGTPHVHGTEICLYAESEPYLDHVRFIFISNTGDTTEIRTVAGTIGQTDWSNCGGSGSYWDVTTLPEGPGQICAIGSADLGGELVTRATDCRNIIIDHSLPYTLNGRLPSSHGLLGGYCELVSEPGDNLEDIWVHFNNATTDAGLDTVWFEWKWAESPNDPEFWMNVGYAYQDAGVTGNWVYSWDVYNYFTNEWDGCGTISLRAALSDNAIPTSNVAYVLFADTIRVDNCPPTVQLTNVNGDLTPDNTVVPWGEIINIVATAEDVFGQGGNSNIDSVCFYGDADDAQDLISCDTQGPLWSAQLATTSIPPNSTYNLRVVAWDEAGNCAEHTISIYVEDSQYQKAYIVGYDLDPEFGCDDYLWAVTDDCDPNWTSSVIFQVSLNQGQTWIPLNDQVNAHNSECNEWLGWNVWRTTLEFDVYPANAWFRVVATDESNNSDPNPAIWRRTDVTITEETQIFAPDWVRVPSNGEQQPWVFTTLEDYTEACLIEDGLVCVEPEAGSSFYAGELPLNTRPCQLEDEDGRITVFTSNNVTQGDNVFTHISTYAMDIHEANYQGGSNGTLVSEDGALEVTIPAWGTGWRGSLWFQPYLETQSHSLVPAYQYYYTLISTVEEIQSDDLDELDIVQPASSFRMRFDNSLLPENAEEWQVVVAYWNWDASDASGQYEGMWQEWGITYNDRDLENGIVDFQWTPDWDVSDLTSVCPDRARFGVFITSIRPIDEFVRLSNGADCSTPPDGLPFYNGVPVTDCDPLWWVVLGEGEYPPTPDRVDVWLDGIRIVNDGEVAEMDDIEGYEDCDFDELFTTHYDDISGMFTVQMNESYYSCPPWFGCLTQGNHTIQFFVDDRPTNITPFYVDNTEPTAHAEPTYIGDVEVTIWADLVDRESGIDTLSVYLDLANCGVENSDYVHEITNEAMTFTPIMENDVLIGYRASVTVQWDGLIESIFLDWYDDEYPYYSEALSCPLTMCAHWHVYNNVCDYNDETQDYRYTVDIVPPVITPVGPVGAAIDDDNDGVANEDGVDCENNDGDFFWTQDWGWRDRYDEDPINYDTASFNCGERPAIQGSISDWGRCCYGAAGINLDGVQWIIDGTMYTIADTANAGLNFFVNQPGQNDFTFNFGGIASGEASDVFYTPGNHQITMFVPDNAGNIGTTDAQTITWAWHVECPGPAIEFNPGDCATWFNPEFSVENPQEFTFVVSTVESAPIAPNGIEYVVRTVPDGIILAGPTTIDPDGRDEVEVTFQLSGAFPDGQTAISVDVTTRNIFAAQGGTEGDGTNHSAMTYTADGCAPVESAHFPATGDSVQNDGNVVVEVHYNDDCDGALFNTGGTVTLGKSSATVTSSTGGKTADVSKSGTLIGRGEAGTLDDNGSGVIANRTYFILVPPRGEVRRYDEEGDFIERTTSSAKIVLVDPVAGVWTVNAYAEDCVGNLATWTWTFRVLSNGPVAQFTTNDEATCQYNGFWNPDRPLYFAATVEESDGANVRNGDISVHFVGLFDNNGTIEEQDLTANVTLDITPAYDNSNVEQTFEITGEATFGDFGGLGVPTDIRIVLTAGDQFGTVTEIVQTWVVDATAPVIQVLTPLPNSMVNGDLPVTISARFYDDEDASAVGKPGDASILMDKNITPTTGFIGGINMKGSKGDAAATITTTKLDLGAWRDAMTRGISSLDGNSGVDPDCIEFRLLNQDNGEWTDLMPNAAINGGIINWVGNLEDGQYSVILTVCDYVCNTSSEIWGFQVVSYSICGENIAFHEPYHVSAMPHCFEATVDCEQIDRSTVTMTVEGAMLVDDQLVFAPIVVDAPVTFNGDTATYCANFDLTGLNSIRVTLNGNFTGGAPMAPISQLYTVDVSAPIFTNVQPLSDDENPLAVGEPLTFRVDFAEVGTVGLDPASVSIWLTTEVGTNAGGEQNVSIAGNGLTGYATLAFTGLEAGNYTLHAEVSDFAGNRATGEWGQRVGHKLIAIGGETYNYPNPFTPEDGYTTFVLPIEAGSGNGAYVSIKMYDFSGRFVATVYEGTLADNNTAITWAGTNDKGEEVANGVYLANVTVSGDGKTVNNIVKVAYKKEQN